MTEYALSYTLSPDMSGRAMMSWAQPHHMRAVTLWRAGAFIAVCAVLVVVIASLQRHAIVNDAFVPGALVGFYLAIGLWALFQRHNTHKLVGLSQQALARQGPVQTTFATEHVILTTAISSRRMDWPCFDDISALPDATVLRAEGVVYAVPDAALRAGRTPQSFRGQLTKWMEASRCNNPLA